MREGACVWTLVVARPLPGANFKWLNDAGFGRIDPEACLTEAELIHTREDKT